jgi:hypothetical protein
MRDPFEKKAYAESRAEAGLRQEEQEGGFEGLMNKTIRQAENLAGGANIIALIKPRLVEIQEAMGDVSLEGLCTDIAREIPDKFFPDHIEDEKERAALIGALAKVLETPRGEN